MKGKNTLPTTSNQLQQTTAATPPRIPPKAAPPTHNAERQRAREGTTDPIQEQREVFGTVTCQCCNFNFSFGNDLKRSAHRYTSCTAENPTSQQLSIDNFKRKEKPENSLLQFLFANPEPSSNEPS